MSSKRSDVPGNFTSVVTELQTLPLMEHVGLHNLPV